jgi:hypothetical protein
MGFKWPLLIIFFAFLLFFFTEIVKKLVKIDHEKPVALQGIKLAEEE